MLEAAVSRKARTNQLRSASKAKAPLKAAASRTPPRFEDEIGRVVPFPEAARILGTSERWLDFCGKRGGIQIVYLSARRRGIRASEINRFIAERSESGGAQQ